jgi:hypothetical protein
VAAAKAPCTAVSFFLGHHVPPQSPVQNTACELQYLELEYEVHVSQSPLQSKPQPYGFSHHVPIAGVQVSGVLGYTDELINI